MEIKPPQFPKLKILDPVHKSGNYALVGFEEVDQVARQIDPIWNQARKEALFMTEIDQLKFLCTALLFDRHQQLDLRANQAMEGGE